MKQERTQPDQPYTRWQIFRKLLVFQYKLLIDAAKDFLLSPLAIIAAAVDLIHPGPSSRMLFPELMRLGRRAEDAINLFGRPVAEMEWTLDRVVDGVESSLRRRHRAKDREAPGNSIAPGDDS